MSGRAKPSMPYQPACKRSSRVWVPALRESARAAFGTLDFRVLYHAAACATPSQGYIGKRPQRQVVATGDAISDMPRQSCYFVGSGSATLEVMAGLVPAMTNEGYLLKNLSSAEETEM